MQSLCKIMTLVHNFECSKYVPLQITFFCAQCSFRPTKEKLLVSRFFLCSRGLGPLGGIERSGCPYVCASVDQVKIFVQGRISKPINGSKLIFHLRMYLYETSRNIQKQWPHDLYFTVHWLRTLARLSRLRFLSKVESLMVAASWYFICGCTSMRPAGIYEPWTHDPYFTVC